LNDLRSVNMTETVTTVEPVAERIVSDVDTLKALSDPVRLRILETMVRAPGETWTVKRIATSLGVGPTRLYHHIAVLEERDLIRVAGTRVVSGIIETSYRIAQLSVRLDRSLLSAAPGDAATAAVEDAVRSIFDSTRDDVAAAIHAGSMGTTDEAGGGRGMLRQDLKRLDPARAAELKTRLSELLDEFDSDASTAGDGIPFGLLVAFYPVAETVTENATEPTDD